jgi:SAM-dependent methyltransferase
MISRPRLFLKLVQHGIDLGPILTRLEVRDALQGCDTVLDVGCGPVSTLRLLDFKRLVGIDGYQPSVEQAKKNATHDELVLGDIRELDRFFKPDQFDACVALDVIEHLTKEDGLKLAKAMERAASKRVVFFTPNGFLPQRHAERDDLQEHLSGWEVEEMRRLGYRVIGMLGPKWLRGELHVIRWRPRFLWGVIAWVLHAVWYRRHPASAAAILCVKTHNKKTV